MSDETKNEPVEATWKLDPEQSLAMLRQQIERTDRAMESMLRVLHTSLKSSEPDVHRDLALNLHEMRISRILLTELWKLATGQDWPQKDH